MDKRYSVYVGGVEVNDYLVDRKLAEAIASDYKHAGYDDVSIYPYESEELMSYENISH